MPSKTPSAKYLARAAAFSEAIDVGTAIAQAVPGVAWEDWETLYKAPALAPEPVFATLKSLAYLEGAFFTYWNEASGEHVERFWQHVAERGLPFQRRDLVREALSRGRIKTDMEYQAIVDAWVVLQQIGKLSQAEAESLSKMVEQFEQRAKSSKRTRSG